MHFFLFKQKTAYEMRISDWSSDVCSSDLIDRLSDTYEIDGHKLSIGASIGIAFGPTDGATAHNLIRSADLALYRAKDAGRGTVRRYMPEMHREAEERRQLETELRSALKHGALTSGERRLGQEYVSTSNSQG